MRITSFAAFSLILSLFFSANSHADPSFSCAKAQSDTERSICAGPVLAMLDRELAKIYDQLVKTGDSNAILLAASQVTWLGLRDKRCNKAKIDCIQSAYFDRIYQLKRYRETRDASVFEVPDNGSFIEASIAYVLPKGWGADSLCKEAASLNQSDDLIVRLRQKLCVAFQVTDSSKFPGTVKEPISFPKNVPSWLIDADNFASGLIWLGASHNWQARRTAADYFEKISPHLFRNFAGLIAKNYLALREDRKARRILLANRDQPLPNFLLAQMAIKERKTLGPELADSYRDDLLEEIVGHYVAALEAPEEEGSISNLSSDQKKRAARFLFTHFSGFSTPAAARMAAKYSMTAALHGDTAAQIREGVKIGLGKEGKADLPAAFQWFERAALGGDRSAQKAVGILLLIGKGAPQNYRRSYIWFSLAAISGDQESLELRNMSAENLSPDQIAYAQALAAMCFSRGLSSCAGKI